MRLQTFKHIATTFHLKLVHKLFRFLEVFEKIIQVEKNLGRFQYFNKEVRVVVQGCLDHDVQEDVVLMDSHIEDQVLTFGALCCYQVCENENSLTSDISFLALAKFKNFLDDGGLFEEGLSLRQSSCCDI